MPPCTLHILILIDVTQVRLFRGRPRFIHSFLLKLHNHMSFNPFNPSSVVLKRGQAVQEVSTYWKLHRWKCSAVHHTFSGKCRGFCCREEGAKTRHCIHHLMPKFTPHRLREWFCSTLDQKRPNSRKKQKKTHAINSTFKECHSQNTYFLSKIISYYFCVGKKENNICVCLMSGDLSCRPVTRTWAW